MSSSFILRGWTEVEDLNTFIEVLNRVRASHDMSSHSLDDNLKFLETRMVGAKEEFDEKSSKSSGEELVESKDSGIGETPETKEKREDEEEEENGKTEETEAEEEVVKKLLEKRDSAAAIAVCFRSSFSSPTLGPFLSCLVGKMDSMVHNTLYINLHLTGVLSQLSRYPQPLLNSLLLNPTLVFQPSIRSLFQVLGSLKHRIDAYAFSVSSFEKLLVRGRKHLGQRERKFFNRRDRSCSDEGSVGSGSTGDIVSIQIHGSKPRSFSEMFHLSSPDKRTSHSETKPRAATIETSSGGPRNHRFYHHKQSAESSLEALRTKNMVYCAIVLEEFLKELAAISQEHAVAYQMKNNNL